MNENEALNQLAKAILSSDNDIFELNLPNRPQCKRCKIQMSIGKGLVNPMKRSVDFANDLDYGVTCSPDLSKAELKSVWKCEKCGYSKEIK